MAACGSAGDEPAASGAASTTITVGHPDRSTDDLAVAAIAIERSYTVLN